MTGHLEKFPCCARCIGRDTHVLVACPQDCRFGDVRKSLAALLNMPFSAINISPIHKGDLSSEGIDPVYPSDDQVPWEINSPIGGTFSVAIKCRDSRGLWVDY